MTLALAEDPDWFSSQRPHCSSQLSVTPPNGDPQYPFLASVGTIAHSALTYMLMIRQCWPLISIHTSDPSPLKKDRRYRT